MLTVDHPPTCCERRVKHHARNFGLGQRGEPVGRSGAGGFSKRSIGSLCTVPGSSPGRLVNYRRTPTTTDSVLQLQLHNEHPHHYYTTTTTASYVLVHNFCLADQQASPFGATHSTRTLHVILLYILTPLPPPTLDHTGLALCSAQLLQILRTLTIAQCCCAAVP
jgi:hypothetical protein